MSNEPQIKVKINAKAISKKYEIKSDHAIRILKNEIARDTDNYVPMQNRILRNSITKSIVSTKPQIVYDTVYARFLYYGKVMVGKITRRAWANKGETKETINKSLMYSHGGDYWFKRSKEKNFNRWLNVVKKLFR